MQSQILIPDRRILVPPARALVRPRCAIPPRFKRHALVITPTVVIADGNRANISAKKQRDSDGGGGGGGGGLTITALGKGEANATGIVTATSNSFSVTAGDYLILTFSEYGGIGSDPTITNSGTPITWNAITSGAATDTQSRVGMMWGIAAATETITVSATVTGTNFFVSVGCGRIDGSATTSIDAAGITGNGGTNAPTANIADTTVANGIVLGVATWTGASTATAGTGYNVSAGMSFTTNDIAAMTVVYKASPGIGANDPLVALSGTDTWAMSGVALKP